MLEIAESNGETSNNSARLAAATLAISVTRLVATALAIPVIATPFKLVALAIPIAAAPLVTSASFRAWKGRQK
jgi:hypothetical protein